MSNALKSSEALQRTEPPGSSFWIYEELSTAALADSFYSSQLTIPGHNEEFSIFNRSWVFSPSIALMTRCYEVLRSIISPAIIQVIGLERAVRPRQGLSAPVTRVLPWTDLIEEDQTVLQEASGKIRKWVSVALDHAIAWVFRSWSRWFMLPLPLHMTGHRTGLSFSLLQSAWRGVKDEALSALSADAIKSFSSPRLLRTALQRAVLRRMYSMRFDHKRNHTRLADNL